VFIPGVTLSLFGRAMERSVEQNAAIAVFGAAGATASWASSANWRALAVVLLAASVYVGVDAWWVTLGPR